MSEKKKDFICMKLAWMMPRRLVKWAAVRLMAHATTGKYSSVITPELLAVDALARWDDRDA